MHLYSWELNWFSEICAEQSNIGSIIARGYHEFLKNLIILHKCAFLLMFINKSTEKFCKC